MRSARNFEESFLGLGRRLRREPYRRTRSSSFSAESCPGSTFHFLALASAVHLPEWYPVTTGLVSALIADLRTSGRLVSSPVSRGRLRKLTLDPCRPKGGAFSSSRGSTPKLMQHRTGHDFPSGSCATRQGGGEQGAVPSCRRRCAGVEPGVGVKLTRALLYSLRGPRRPDQATSVRPLQIGRTHV